MPNATSQGAPGSGVARTPRGGIRGAKGGASLDGATKPSGKWAGGRPKEAASHSTPLGWGAPVRGCHSRTAPVRNLPATAGPSTSRCAVPAAATWPPARGAPEILGRVHFRFRQCENCPSGSRPLPSPH